MDFLAGMNRQFLKRSVITREADDEKLIFVVAVAIL